MQLPKLTEKCIKKKLKYKNRRNKMNSEEFYKAINGDYLNTLNRLGNEQIVSHFIKEFKTIKHLIIFVHLMKITTSKMLF